MKKQSLIFSLLGVLFLFSSISAHAQVVDTCANGMFCLTEKIIKTPATFQGQFDRSVLSGGGFSIPSTDSFTPISKSASSQTQSPAKIRVSRKPVTLRKEGKALTFSCQQDCKNCRLFWWDRNKDDKVQPRKELRCACTREQMCNIQVKRE